MIPRNGRYIHRNRLVWLAALAASALLGCSGLDGSSIHGLGGAFGVGGSEQTGVSEGAGGAASPGTGGVPATGGIPNVGGKPTAGGSDATGGSLGASSTGGALASGGALSTGGTSSTSGVLPMGGTSTAGGAQPVGGTLSNVGGSTAGSTGGYPLKNTPVPSTGCSKAFSTFKSGTNTYKTTSAGLNREYIVALPDKYDSNTPHRVVFGMHWMNGSAEAVQGWSKWFGLKALDTTNSTVFVAPNGYGSPPLWNQGIKDHAFFDDMVKLLESELCVDTSRVFSVGFSFGAMFTNSLAQTHQDVLRGVVVYAAADFNIYFPTNTGKPLAYMGVHGLKDPTCPIASGRSSRDRFVKNNRCTVPGTVPEAKSGGNYVTYDYQCPSNYPVRWVTFDGKHTCPPNDTGTWVYGKTWEFISQF